MELSVVIPIYHTSKNAARYIPDVISTLKRKFRDFEILFIIDNNPIPADVKDLKTLQNIYKEIKIFPLNKNYGQHFATLSGYYMAKGDHILCVDEDMTQYVIEICQNDDYKNYEIYFWHYNKNNMYSSVIRKVFSILFKALIHRIINFKKNSTFRVITKQLRDKILMDKHIFWNIDVMIFNNTDHIGGCTVDFFDVKDDNSGYNYKTLINIAFEIAYEHNTIFMNLLFALFPTLLINLIYHNIIFTVNLYLFIVILITLLFLGIKKMTPTTKIKIQKALLIEKNSRLFKPIPE